jgi:hypothetical protein
MRLLWTALLLGGCSEAPRTEGQFIEGQKHHMGTAPEEPNHDERCRGALETFRPEGGIVPTSQVAERVTRTYLRSLYGSHFREEERLEIGLESGIWIIRSVPPEDTLGGGMEISICQSNGRVLGYSASQ